ncbi:flagellar export chaperone FliS [Granulosicoccaceae sp. 1_MG-2023]|nr:flagellar export chaperone FliS [Granulosicoccaceae sp. 1_MG-2023]
MNAFSGANAYQQVNRFSALEGASPHRLVCMLMQGAIDRLAIAKGMMERKDYSGKGEVLAKVIAIISELKGSLDLENGGDVARNMDQLYDYMMRTILSATSDNDPLQLDHVAELLNGLLQAWNSIPEDQKIKP